MASCCLTRDSLALSPPTRQKRPNISAARACDASASKLAALQSINIIDSYGAAGPGAL